MVARGPEDARRVMAKFRGYFWAPCPMCGEMFAGYEAGRHSIPYRDKPGTGRICCMWCDDNPNAEALIAEGFGIPQRWAE